MACPTRFAFAFLAVSLMGSLAAAQTASEIYALRQDLRNDSFVWEPMYKQAVPKTPKPRLVNPAAAAPRGPARVQLDGAARAVLQYYGKAPRQIAPPAKASPARVDQAVAPASHTQPAGGRPFDEATSSPTVSAYMGLYREGFDDWAPNYHTQVRPQLREQQLARRERFERRRTGRGPHLELPTASRVTSAINAGSTSHYRDTGGYFGAWVR